ncbi:DUF2306 domain-containing protein [Paraflavitalea pollutisoli]|uniref:DUF2306 domain-containing protein n=1 Tax=Paraflavitalea pollutisoli TaxID=3034143 RepID=UPI0023EC38A6|nr:DUF2306 domain-containing protein [Paraflavitalea sp. H1-2-19X]
MNTLAFIARNFMVYIVLCAASLLMLRLVISYTSFQDDVAFLAYKQEYLHNRVWKIAFYVHVFSAVLSLLAAFTQFSKDLLTMKPALHRWGGRIYAWNILAINVPAGFILAIHANGGWSSRIAFMILDICWAWFTYKGVTAAIRGDITLHRAFMIRSYALTFSAITLRLWKNVLVGALHYDPLLAYMIQAWIGYVPNMLVAEYIIYRSRKKQWLTSPLQVNHNEVE